MKRLRSVLSAACFLGFGAIIFTAGTHPSEPNAGLTAGIHSTSASPGWYPSDRDDETEVSSK